MNLKLNQKMNSPADSTLSKELLRAEKEIKKISYNQRYANDN